MKSVLSSKNSMLKSDIVYLVCSLAQIFRRLLEWALTTNLKWAAKVFFAYYLLNSTLISRILSYYPTIPIMLINSQLFSLLLNSPESFGKTESLYKMSSYCSYMYLKDRILSKGIRYFIFISPLGTFKALFKFFSCNFLLDGII